MENEAFALLEQTLHSPYTFSKVFKTELNFSLIFLQYFLKIENDAII